MALFERAIQRGLHADRPAPGAPGVCYFETDTGNGYRDSGTTWELITSLPPSGYTIQTMGDADLTIARGNTLVRSTGAGHTATLPAVADSAGETVIFKNMGSSPSTLAAASGEVFQDGRASIPTGGDNGAVIVWCDGLQWLLVSAMYNSTDWS